MKTLYLLQAQVSQYYEASLCKYSDTCASDSNNVALFVLV